MSYGKPTMDGQLRRMRRAIAVDIHRRPWLWGLVIASYVPIRLAVEFIRPGG